MVIVCPVKYLCGVTFVSRAGAAGIWTVKSPSGPVNVLHSCRGCVAMATGEASSRSWQTAENNRLSTGERFILITEVLATTSTVTCRVRPLCP